MRAFHRKALVRLFLGMSLTLGLNATPAAAQNMPAVDVVIGNNFGHLPMFVGVEQGLFKKHGVDVRLKVVNTGTDMVNAMQKREVQIGDMSVTTFLKARHAGDSFMVIGIIMNDATRDNADEPLAIVARDGSGIGAGKVEDLKGKRVGLAKGQTSDEYFKMVRARRGMRYDEVTVENIMAPLALAPALKDGRVDAVVSWEPYNTAVLEQVPPVTVEYTPGWASLAILAAESLLMVRIPSIAAFVHVSAIESGCIRISSQ
jgi:NitT/TauT family transport system substrate-binding protein